ncbi:MAG TPA: cell division protein FtsZ, partial [Geminicoccaceae bacterium]|nr:cell division protein FtsZ [Geminicoccaceae bacterium]
AGARPEVGRAAAEEALDEILDQLSGSHMVFITAGMGGGTGTGAAPVIARAVREQGILTVAVVTKPFHFEGAHRMRLAEAGLGELQQYVDTLIVIPNQNLFRLANERTTFADAFQMADQVLHMGVRGVTDLMVMPGLINLDFADIRTVMSEMGKAMMGTGEAEGERRAIEAAEAAISNPLLDDVSMKGARGVLINITGGLDMTLYEVDAAANRIREEVDANANIIFGSTFDDSLQGRMRVSVVSTGIDLPQAGMGNVPASVPEAQPEQQRLGLGQFRFQVQRPQAVPFPGQAKPAARRPIEVSPAVHLRAASEGHEREGFEPAPEQAAAVPTIGQQPRTVATPPAAVVPEFSGFRAVVARSEERSPNLFARVKEFAFTRTAVDRPAERHPPRLPDRDQRPLADVPASLSGATDEISDIPSFLRRERVEG